MAYRKGRFSLSEEGFARRREEFGLILIRAITEGIEGVVGESIGKTIEFHVDPRIALSDSNDFASRLEKLFGPASNLMLKVIIARLEELVGSNIGEGSVFGDAVTRVEADFAQKGRP